MKLYNTLTRKVEDFEPQNAPEVKIYTCGLTVYDYSHLGHWFTYVRTDMLIRTLKINGFQPKWIMNITDVGHLVSDADEGEDKLEKGAKREGKTAWEVADFYTRDFEEGMKLLNITQPDEMPKATGHISEQVDLISTLEQKGYTYKIDDGIYYDTSKFSSYSDFAQLHLDEQQDNGRIAQNPQKRNQSDFALWKFSPENEKRDMEWDSPWGTGFPGWHIECSAMAMAYLGKTLDIHTGGIDHIPVHHTNEIAQSEAATGERWSNYWMHANHVTVNGEKISKSLSNGIRIQEIVDKGIAPEALRLHILESHYTKQAKFTWEGLEAAQNRLQELKAMAVLRWQALPTVNDGATFALEEVPNQVAVQLANDLSTPQVLAFLSQVSTQLLTVLIEEDMVSHFESMLRGLDEALGLNLLMVPDISSEQKKLIKDRETARQSKDWAKSDILRDELASQGIGLRDTPQTIIWYWM